MSNIPRRAEIAAALWARFGIKPGDIRWVDDEPEAAKPACNHEFVQNGCRKSWCSHCDCEGLFDFESGTFKPS